ncbi:uncharacterized protein LOC141605474 [Silene latifolia]|uniref:uncharacterized protein LOC141605474 n=1 Tax=Silene latifolia TaxID=37657 RepID=UPI003D76FB0C
MSHNLRAICRPNAVFTSMAICCKDHGVSLLRRKLHFRSSHLTAFPSRSVDSSLLSSDFMKNKTWLRSNHRRYVAKASNWTGEKSPYDVLELEGDEDDEQIKFAYRRLAKFYHPDVYDGRGNLEEGETAETRFIKVQAAYELLMDRDKRKEYDVENRVDPLKASQAWMEWLIKKRKAFDQRGDMAIAAWAEQQQRDMNLRARQRARSKVDPEEEKRILAREKKASIENFQTTLRRHTLVLKKRDLMRKKAEEEKKKEISRLLAAEGFELDSEDDK